MSREQWFPGHIYRAKKSISNLLKNSNSLLLVLDARAPYSSIAFDEFSKIKQKRNVLVLLNKSDLADDKVTEDWIKYYSNQGFKTLKFSIKRPVKRTSLLNLLKLENKITKILVLGIPNVGKSTILNYLIGKKSAKTANKAGVTRGVQWIALDDTTLLLDTPGILFANLSNEDLFKKLAYIKAINTDKIDMLELVYKLIDFLREFYPSYLSKLYNSDEPAHIFLSDFCIHKNFILKGGVPDLKRGAFYIFNLVVNGKLGKISYERVTDAYIK